MEAPSESLVRSPLWGAARFPGPVLTLGVRPQILRRFGDALGVLVFSDGPQHRARGDPLDSLLRSFPITVGLGAFDERGDHLPKSSAARKVTASAMTATPTTASAMIERRIAAPTWCASSCATKWLHAWISAALSVRGNPRRGIRRLPRTALVDTAVRCCLLISHHHPA